LPKASPRRAPTIRDLHRSSSGSRFRQTSILPGKTASEKVAPRKHHTIPQRPEAEEKSWLHPAKANNPRSRPMPPRRQIPLAEIRAHEEAKSPMREDASAYPDK